MRGIGWFALGALAGAVGSATAVAQRQTQTPAIEAPGRYQLSVSPTDGTWPNIMRLDTATGEVVGCSALTSGQRPVWVFGCGLTLDERRLMGAAADYAAERVRPSVEQAAAALRVEADRDYRRMESRPSR